MFLSQYQVMKNGIEFAGDVCYSGEYGQQVYTKDMDDGGIPLDGILYEMYPNGSINYYCYYSNGVPHGERVRYYESGKIKNFCIMNKGTIDGEYTELYESGIVKKKEFCKYGVVLKMQVFDENGNLVKEKKELSESEKKIYEKRVAYYERD